MVIIDFPGTAFLDEATVLARSLLEKYAQADRLQIRARVGNNGIWIPNPKN